MVCSFSSTVEFVNKGAIKWTIRSPKKRIVVVGYNDSVYGTGEIPSFALSVVRALVHTDFLDTAELRILLGAAGFAYTSAVLEFSVADGSCRLAVRDPREGFTYTWAHDAAEVDSLVIAAILYVN